MQTGTPVIKTIAFLAAGIFMSLVAVVIGVEQMYFMGAVLLLTPLVAFIIGWCLLWGLEIERRLPYACDEGERVLVEVTVTNTARLPKFFITVTDKLPVWLKYAGTDGNMILQLEPGASQTITYYVEAAKRGVYPVGPAVVSGSDPFGFSTFRHSLQGTVKSSSADSPPNPGELVVYPTPLPLFSSLVQPGAYGWRGDQEGLRRGTGADFQGVREYQHGDDLRRVHWRTTARMGKLAVAEYSQGETLDMLLALDLSFRAYQGTGEGHESALEYAVKLAATLCDDLTRNGHTVRLLTTALGENDTLATNAGKWSAPLLEALARAEATSNKTLADVLAGYRTEAPRGAMLVYLTPEASSDLGLVLAEYEAGGALTAGFIFDGASFAAGPPGRLTGPFNARIEATALSDTDRLEAVLSGPVRCVRRGDDLVDAIHDLLSRNRGVRGRAALSARGIR